MTPRKCISATHRQTLVIALLLALMAGLFMPHHGASGASAESTPPILLVTSTSVDNPNNNYLMELLKAEGIGLFDAVPLSALTASSFVGRSVVILVETTLSADRAALISNYVNAGGNIIAMRPDGQIANLFGLQAKDGMQDDGYVAIDPHVTLVDDKPGLGLPADLLQIHGPVDLHALQPGAVAVAQLHSKTGTPTGYAAVTRFLKDGGARVAFSYDLARSVVLTRQGNPAWAATAEFTPDLFRPQAGTSWVDLKGINIPQADEQLRLLANIVMDLADADAALPQLWYFPNAAKAVLLPTVNSVSEPIAFLEPIVKAIEESGGHGTFFVGIGGLDPVDISSLRAAGHDISILPTNKRLDPMNPGCCEITSLSEGFTKQTAWFNLNMHVSPSMGVRTEAYRWHGWIDAAHYADSNGYGMDFAHATIGSWLKKEDGNWARGYLNGSGRPMKYISADGVILPVYQQVTDLVDGQLLAAAGTNGEQLSTAEAIAVARERITEAASKNYAAVVIAVTANSLSRSQVDWMSEAVKEAQNTNVPVLTAAQWWAFNDARDNTRLTEVAWDNANNKLTFNAEVTATSVVSVTTVLPVIYRDRSLRKIRIDGMDAPFTVSNVKLTNKAFIVLPNGKHQIEAVYESDVPIGALTAGIQSAAPHILTRDVAFEASVDAGTGVSYLWDFGDGSFGSGSNPSHVYSRWGNNGTYTITVTATNAAGTRVTTFPIQLTLPPALYLPVALR